MRFSMRRRTGRNGPMIAAGLSVRDHHHRMQRVLQREHARAKRNGKPFALVVMQIDRLAAHRSVRRLQEAIRQRARLTDEIGWLDSDRLAILLPDTGDAGAKQFAACLEKLPQFSAVRPQLAVHTYPPAQPSPAAPTASQASPALPADPIRRFDIPLDLPIQLELPMPARNMEGAWPL